MQIIIPLNEANLHEPYNDHCPCDPGVVVKNGETIIQHNPLTSAGEIGWKWYGEKE